MPLYEFRCRACGEEFEEILSPSESQESVECPRCQADRPERRLSVFGLGGPSTGGASSSSSSSCGSGSFG